MLTNYFENIDKIFNYENGLLLFNPPTGFGKTHEVLSWIFENYEKYCAKDKKIFFITNLKKNLPFNELRDTFFKPHNKLAEFKRDVIFLDSNYDFLLNNFENVKIDAKEFFNNLDLNNHKPNIVDEMASIIRAIKNYENKNIDKFYLIDLKDKLRNYSEPKFRKIIKNILDIKFNNRQEKIEAIKTQDAFKWIGELYPAVFTCEKKVFFLSMDKFYFKNSTLVEPAYSFLESDLTKEAIIFIDEFDATKETILKNIIETGLKQKIDFIQLFSTIYMALSNKTLPQKLITTPKKNVQLFENEYQISLDNIQEKLLKKAKEIAEYFQLDYSFKTQNNDDRIINQRNLLFHDFCYHSVYRNNKKYISFTTNESSKINEIIFGENKSEGKSIIYLLGKIRGFINYFSIIVKYIAENYRQNEKEERSKNPNAIEFTFNFALSSVLEEFGLYGEFKNYLMEVTLGNINKQKINKVSHNEYYNIYKNGFRYYDFVDNESHQTKTKIYSYSFENTPEKFLLKLAKNSKVIGISATALAKTVIGNYDLNFLRRELKSKYIELNSEEKKRIAMLFADQNKYYNKINIKVNWLEYRNFESDFIDLFADEEIAIEMLNKINLDLSYKITDKNKIFFINRYLQISNAFNEFLIHDDIKGFLCLLNKEPKFNDRDLNLKILEEIFQNLIEKYENNNTDELDLQNIFTIINSSNFESKKANFIKRLETGKKIFIISTYKTIGAGQNLQFISPNPNELINVNSEELPHWNKSNKTDINAIYLDKPSNTLQNINENLNEVSFVNYIFQLEFLVQVGIISVKHLTMEVTRTFKYFLKLEKNNSQIYLYDTEDAKEHISKIIIQAIGRICRTNLKSPNIYIYANKTLENSICNFDIENNLVLNEFKTMVNSCKLKSNSKIDSVIKTLASTSNNRMYIKIQEFMNKALIWNAEYVEQWKELRKICLRFPTVSEIEANKYEFIDLNSYIQLPKDSNKYYFELEQSDEYNDFKNIEVDFLANSGKEVSAKAARLDKFLEIEGIKELFKKNKWATEFKINKYIIPPVVFNNIYKGALGEEVGKFILINYLKIELEELPIADYEKFDFKIKNHNVYIDFKHWRETTEIEIQKLNIRKKLEDLQADKVFIINILAEKCRTSINSADGKIIEIPYLWNTKKREFNHAALKGLRDYAKI